LQDIALGDGEAVQSPNAPFQPCPLPHNRAQRRVVVNVALKKGTSSNNSWNVHLDQLRMSGTIMDKAPVGLERTTGRVGWGSCGQLHHFSGRKRSGKGDS